MFFVSCRSDEFALNRHSYLWAASWRSGDAADCKSVYTGSIPVLASNKINDLEGALKTPLKLSKHLSKHSVFVLFAFVALEPP
jgi:hypothetical protein